MRKLFLSLSILFAIPFLARGADTDAMMLLRMKDTTVRQFLLASKPEVTFSGNELVISTKDAETRVSVDIADVSSFEFTGTGSLDTVGADAVRVTFDDSTLSVFGLTPGSMMSLFDIAGHELARVVADTDGVASVDMSRLQSGVYIAKSDQITLKIYR